MTAKARHKRTTADVLEHHLECFKAGDLEGILSDYAKDAIMFTPKGPLIGADAIRPMFVSMFSEFDDPIAKFNMITQTVDGPYAYIVWRAETAKNVYELGTDTFVVKRGKIVAQSYAGKTSTKDKPIGQLSA